MITMLRMIVSHSRLLKRWRLFFFLCSFALGCQQAMAHQTPTTIMLLDVSPGKVSMELQLPLSELSLSFGHDIANHPGDLVQKLGPQLKEYLKAHIHAFIKREDPWWVEIDDMKVEEAVQMQSGPPFQEITVHITLSPSKGQSTRQFWLDYDVIMHEVINHAAFVSIRNDWESGRSGAQPVEVGVIRVDTRTSKIYPLQINLEKGDWLTGFQSMVVLGMHHIKEGTDHLLFLLVLLLPAMLLVKRKRWDTFGGTKYSIVRLLKIVTAFTIGHSVTLLLGAIGWLRLPVQPVEILIAFSILVSAVHAIRPIFPGKEIYVAAGFGLIHGSAFASVLSNLNLGAGPMALSILGFNLGIELMQLFVIIIIVPWLIILSRTQTYPLIRVAGASLAGIAAIAWIMERVSGASNPVTDLILQASLYAKWGIVFLAILSILTYAWERMETKSKKTMER